MMTGIKDPGGEGDEGFEEAFDDAIFFPVDSTTYEEMDWSGGSMLKDPKVDKNWLDITIGEAGNFIIVNIKGILERINPLLYQGSFSCGQHKVFLEEENENIKMLIPAEIDVILHQQFETRKFFAKFDHINAAVGKNEIFYLDAVTKEKNANMLEAHIGIDSTSVFKTELKFDIEVYYLKF